MRTVKITVDLTAEDIEYMSNELQKSADGKGFSDFTSLRYAYCVIFNTLGVNIPGLTDKHKGILGFSERPTSADDRNNDGYHRESIITEE